MNVNPGSLHSSWSTFKARRKRPQHWNVLVAISNLWGCSLRHSYLRKLLEASVLTDAESETQRSQDACLRSHNCMVVLLKEASGHLFWVWGVICVTTGSLKTGLAMPRECWGEFTWLTQFSKHSLKATRENHWGVVWDTPPATAHRNGWLGKAQVYLFLSSVLRAEGQRPPAMLLCLHWEIHPED